nr:hypothetical protein [Tanacetum cinerariifolium]
MNLRPFMNCLQIKVCMFEGLVGLVLQLNGKMTSFSINQLIWSTSDWSFVRSLTADGLAAGTLRGEVLGLEEGCQVKGLLRGDLDLDIACEAMLGRVLENFSLTALTVLAAVVSTD